jgi:hypothetical protein
MDAHERHQLFFNDLCIPVSLHDGTLRKEIKVSPPLSAAETSLNRHGGGVLDH